MGTFAGAKVSIGTTAAIDFTNDTTALADFVADTYTEIGSLSNMGEIGASANVLTFPLVSDTWQKKGKGLRNGGDPAIVVERDSADAGQQAVRAAEKTKYFYNFKLELSDAVDEDHTNTIFYFRALVASANNQLGGNEDFVTETYTLGVYPGPLIIESEEI